MLLLRSYVTALLFVFFLEKEEEEEEISNATSNTFMNRVEEKE